MKPITKWQIFLHYWGLSLEVGRKRNRWFVDALIKTPLFSVRRCINGDDFSLACTVSGMDVGLFPASWKFDLKEGAIMYRKYLRLMKCSSLY